MSSARLRDHAGRAEPRTGRPFALAVTPGERALLLAAVRAYRTPHLRMKADLLGMLERAMPVGALRELESEQEPASA